MAYRVGRCLLQNRLSEARMTQLELATKLNVTKQQINKYVKGNQNMSLQVAKNISVVLNCNIEHLYEWVEVGNNE